MQPNMSFIPDGSLTGPLPLAMRYARHISVSHLPPAPYDPLTQMSSISAEIMRMGGRRDRSTCTNSSSTNEGFLEFERSDSDRKVDD